VTAEVPSSECRQPWQPFEPLRRNEDQRKIIVTRSNVVRMRGSSFGGTVFGQIVSLLEGVIMLSFLRIFADVAPAHRTYFDPRFDSFDGSWIVPETLVVTTNGGLSAWENSNAIQARNLSRHRTMLWQWPALFVGMRKQSRTITDIQIWQIR